MSNLQVFWASFSLAKWHPLQGRLWLLWEHTSQESPRVSLVTRMNCSLELDDRSSTHAASQAHGSDAQPQLWDPSMFHVMGQVAQFQRMELSWCQSILLCMIWMRATHELGRFIARTCLQKNVVDAFNSSEMATRWSYNILRVWDLEVGSACYSWNLENLPKFCSLLGFATKTGSIIQSNGNRSCGILQGTAGRHDPPDLHRSTKRRWAQYWEKSRRVPLTSLTVKKLLVLTLQLRQQGGDLSSASRSQRMAESNCATLGVHLTSMCSDPFLLWDILGQIESRTTNWWMVSCRNYPGPLYICVCSYKTLLWDSCTVLISPILLACYFGCISNFHHQVFTHTFSIGIFRWSTDLTQKPHGQRRFQIFQTSQPLTFHLQHQNPPFSPCFC